MGRSCLPDQPAKIKLCQATEGPRHRSSLQGTLLSPQHSSLSTEVMKNTEGVYPVAKSHRKAPGRASLVWRRGREFEVALTGCSRSYRGGSTPSYAPHVEELFPHDAPSFKSLPLSFY